MVHEREDFQGDKLISVIAKDVFAPYDYDCRALLHFSAVLTMLP